MGLGGDPLRVRWASCLSFGSLSSVKMQTSEEFRLARILGFYFQPGRRRIANNFTQMKPVCVANLVPTPETGSATETQRKGSKRKFNWKESSFGGKTTFTGLRELFVLASAFRGARNANWVKSATQPARAFLRLKAQTSSWSPPPARLGSKLDCRPRPEPI